MVTLEILTYPDKFLRQPTQPVENIDEDINNLVKNMIETMFVASGIGLAANQVGVLKQVIVFDYNLGKEKQNPGTLINPEVILSEGSITRDEACLSVIDFSSQVTRKAQVKVRGVDLQGHPVDIEAEELLAICLQHEIDHLNGILFIDHISNLKRSLYKKKLKKMLKRQKEDR